VDREYGEHWRLGSHLRCVNVNSYLLLLELQTDLNDERGRSNGVLTDGGTLIHRGNQCDFGRGRGRNEFCARGWVGQLLSPRHRCAGAGGSRQTWARETIAWAASTVDTREGVHCWNSARAHIHAGGWTNEGRSSILLRNCCGGISAARAHSSSSNDRG